MSLDLASIPASHSATNLSLFVCHILPVPLSLMHLLASAISALDNNTPGMGRRFAEDPRTAYTSRRGQIFRFALISYSKDVAELFLDTGPESSLNC